MTILITTHNKITLFTMLSVYDDQLDIPRMFESSMLNKYMFVDTAVSSGNTISRFLEISFDNERLLLHMSQPINAVIALANRILIDNRNKISESTLTSYDWMQIDVSNNDG
ncbi:hypothetical protein ACSKF1_04980 [Lactiplantibacillus plantarum]|uniref:hypothetical protein n=1 Tax=Lactiplantibacillus plantarum TaxID=1590 RepID=UPI003851ED93|nr:hypothetical protein [Lactiplantibacillus plantarum]